MPVKCWYLISYCYPHVYVTTMTGLAMLSVNLFMKFVLRILCSSDTLASSLFLFYNFIFLTSHGMAGRNLRNKLYVQINHCVHHQFICVVGIYCIQLVSFFSSRVWSGEDIGNHGFLILPRALNFQSSAN